MELLEIEKELAGSGRDEALARHDGVLKALSDRLADALRKGLPPDEYARCSELAEAVVVARKLLRLQVREANEERGVGIRALASQEES